MELREYVDEHGHSRFGSWFASLDAAAAARVVVALGKIERGAISNIKPVGEGVAEFKIDLGPGYRIYFGQDGRSLIILLTGGTKKRQNDDVAAAKILWSAYKERKKGKS